MNHVNRTARFPAGVSRRALVNFVDSVGLGSRHIRGLTFDPLRVTLTVEAFVYDEDGKQTVDMENLTTVTETVTIPILDDL